MYNEAHALAKALQSSEEYRAFLAAKKALDTEEPIRRMVRDFMLKQMEAEYEAMSGKPKDAARQEQLQQMAQMLGGNARAREFLDKYMRFQRTMADIQKILGDAVAEGMDFFAKQ